MRDFPGYMIYIGGRDGKVIKDVVIYELDPQGQGPVRNVRSKSGTMTVDKVRRVMSINLYDVRIDHREKDAKTGEVKSTYMNAKEYPKEFNFSDLQKRMPRKKNPDMTFLELIRAVRDVRAAYPELKYEDLLRQRMSMVVEANMRLALSLSCFAFSLLGIPLGMKSRRRESSIGIGISLLLVFVFYFFVIIANSLVEHPELRPDLIVWMPVLIAEILGFRLIRQTE